MEKEEQKNVNMPIKLMTGIIASHYILLRHTMKKHIQSILDNIGDKGVIKCDILIDTPESQGLSDALKPCIISIKKDTEKNSILFNWEDTGEVAFEFMDTDWLIQIVKELDSYVSNMS